jgi:hypothetical protein
VERLRAAPHRRSVPGRGFGAGGQDGVPDVNRQFAYSPSRRMLSVDEMRRLLSPLELTDAEVAEIRDTLYAVAHAMIDGLFVDRSPPPDAPPKKS